MKSRLLRYCSLPDTVAISHVVSVIVKFRIMAGTDSLLVKKAALGGGIDGRVDSSQRVADLIEHLDSFVQVHDFLSV